MLEHNLGVFFRGLVGYISSMVFRIADTDYPRRTWK